MSGRKIEVQIVGDVSSLSRAFGKASDSGSRFGAAMMKAGKFAAIGLAGGLAGAVVVMKKSVDAALEAEKAQTRLDSAFKASNVSAKDRAAAMAQVSKVSVRAGLDDEDLMDTLGRLTRVTGSAAKAQRDMAIAADLARARNLSLEAATKIVEKAELGNVGALKRIGIEIPKVTAAQDALRASHGKVSAEQLKAAKIADDIATRQSAIAALQTQYAGAAERYGNTAAGAQDRFKVAVENLQETLGAKLLPVLTRVLEWTVVHMPQFERAASVAMQKVGAVIEALKPVFAALIVGIRTVVTAARAYWPQVQEAAAQVVAWYRGTLQPVIQNVITALTAFWRRFGADITRIATIAFNTAKTVIVAAMRVIQGVVEGVLAVIRGDWTQAWNSLKQVVSNVFIGIRAIIVGFHKIAFAAMVAVGRALIDGILAGAAGLGSRLKNQLSSEIGSAVAGVKGFLRIGSPSKLMADEVGKPLAEGVVMGYILGAAALPEKMKESVRKAIEAARAAVERSRGALASAFSGVASDALSAFDAIQGQVLTKSEKLLAKLQAQRDAASRAGAVTDAQAGLAAAMLGAEGVVDPAAVAAAQKTLDDALWAQREFGLQQRAIQERRELDARTAMRRRDLESALAALGEKLSKEGAKAATASEAVIKLLGKYGVNFKKVGASMGKAWIEGLKETIEAAAKGAGTLAGVVGKAAAGITVPKLAAGGEVTRTGMALAHRGETVSGVGGNGGGWGSGDIVIKVGELEIARAVRNGNARLATQGVTF